MRRKGIWNTFRVCVRSLSMCSCGVVVGVFAAQTPISLQGRWASSNNHLMPVIQDWYRGSSGETVLAAADPTTYIMDGISSSNFNLGGNTYRTPNRSHVAIFPLTRCTGQSPVTPINGGVVVGASLLKQWPQSCCCVAHFPFLFVCDMCSSQCLEQYPAYRGARCNDRRPHRLPQLVARHGAFACDTDCEQMD